MNYRELYVKEKCEKDGWTVIRGGAPDFLLVRSRPDGSVEAVSFREVKSPDDDLTFEQCIWRDALRFLGAECATEVIE